MRSPLADAVLAMAERVGDAAIDLATARACPEFARARRAHSRRHRALYRLVAALDRQEARR
jgi:hypothetical protein